MQALGLGKLSKKLNLVEKFILFIRQSLEFS